MKSLVTCVALLASFTCALPCAAQQTHTGGATAVLIEAAGGTAGSLAGFALVYSTSGRCDVEDLACNLQHAGAAVLVATAGAAAGAYLAGRLARTQPSMVGAALGAVVGAAGGIGVAHLLTEELNLVNSDTGAIIGYAVAQGTLTALGSRVARALH